MCRCSRRTLKHPACLGHFVRKYQIQPCDFRGHSHFRNQIQKLHFRDDKTGARRRDNVPEAVQHWPPDPVGCSPSRDLEQGPGAGLPSQHAAQGESMPDTGLGPLRGWSRSQERSRDPEGRLPDTNRWPVKVRTEGQGAVLLLCRLCKMDPTSNTTQEQRVGSGFGSHKNVLFYSQVSPRCPIAAHCGSSSSF